MENLKEKYFETFDINRDLVGLDLINEMIKKHYQKSTFNNISVLLEQEAPSLESDYLTKKIIHENRGGYCFEQNKVMFEVLKDLGFDVQSFLARVVYNKDVDAARTHRVTILNYNGRQYLVDVGFGPYGPTKAIPFRSEYLQCLNNSKFRVNESQGIYSLETIREDEPFILYKFDMNEYTDSDYKVANFYTSNSKESKFVTSLIVSKVYEDKAIILQERMFSELLGDKRVDETISSFDQFWEILINKFQYPIDKTEAKRLYKKFE